MVPWRPLVGPWAPLRGPEVPKATFGPNLGPIWSTILGPKINEFRIEIGAGIGTHTSLSVGAVRGFFWIPFWLHVGSFSDAQSVKRLHAENHVFLSTVWHFLKVFRVPGGPKIIENAPQSSLQRQPGSKRVSGGSGP